MGEGNPFPSSHAMYVTDRSTKAQRRDNASQRQRKQGDDWNVARGCIYRAFAFFSLSPTDAKSNHRRLLLLSLHACRSHAQAGDLHWLTYGNPVSIQSHHVGSKSAPSGSRCGLFAFYASQDPGGVGTPARPLSAVLASSAASRPARPIFQLLATGTSGMRFARGPEAPSSF